MQIVCVCVSRWDRHRRGCIRTRACSDLDLLDPSLEDVHDNILELEVVALELRERLGQGSFRTRYSRLEESFASIIS